MLQEARKIAASEPRRLTFHGLTSNTTYKVRMRAENTIDNSTWSGFVEATTTVSRGMQQPILHMSRCMQTGKIVYYQCLIQLLCVRMYLEI